MTAAAAASTQGAELFTGNTALVGAAFMERKVGPQPQSGMKARHRLVLTTPHLVPAACLPSDDQVKFSQLLKSWGASFAGNLLGQSSVGLRLVEYYRPVC